jgi:hypothetical protein
MCVDGIIIPDSIVVVFPSVNCRFLGDQGSIPCWELRRHAANHSCICLIGKALDF